MKDLTNQFKWAHCVLKLPIVEYPKRVIGVTYSYNYITGLNAKTLTFEARQEKLNKPGKGLFDDLRKKRIDDLEKNNVALRARLYGYEKEHSDWETFKREFNHDMEGLGEAFKNLGKDNTK